MQAQERLLVLDWPQSLLRHELCRPVALGDLLKDGNGNGNGSGNGCNVAGKGGPVISGLRVRMGINTGEGGGQ